MFWTWDICVPHSYKKIENVTLDIALQWPGYHKWHLRQVAQTSVKLTPGQSGGWGGGGGDQTYGSYYSWTSPVGFWIPNSSSFSSSDSFVVEEAARNIRSPPPSINKSREMRILYWRASEASETLSGLFNRESHILLLLASERSERDTLLSVQLRIADIYIIIIII